MFSFDLVDASWGGWTEWTYCDKGCNTGYKKRFRECTKGLYGGVRDCVGNQTEMSICHTQRCPSNKMIIIFYFILCVLSFPEIQDTKNCILTKYASLHQPSSAWNI